MRLAATADKMGALENTDRSGQGEGYVVYDYFRRVINSLENQIAQLTGGGVTSVTSANADISIPSPSPTPVLTLNSGTGANKIVKFDGTGKYPAADGSQITNISGIGTVTSVGITSTDASITVVNSPITSSGNIDLSVNVNYPIYPADQIVFGDGITPGGTTDVKLTYAPTAFSVGYATNGSTLSLDDTAKTLTYTSGGARHMLLNAAFPLGTLDILGHVESLLGTDSKPSIAVNETGGGGNVSNVSILCGTPSLMPNTPFTHIARFFVDGTDLTSIKIVLGDANFIPINNGTVISLVDDVQNISMSTLYNGTAGITFNSKYLTDGSVGFTDIGDLSNQGNGLKASFNDVTSVISFDNAGHNVVLSVNGVPTLIGTANTAGLWANNGSGVVSYVQATGWTNATGTASRANFDPNTVTLTQLAQRVTALINDGFTTTLLHA